MTMMQTMSQPIVQASDFSTPSIFSEQYAWIRRLLVQWDRLRAAGLDFDVVMLMPLDLCPTWVQVYGINIVHIQGLTAPILGYLPDSQVPGRVGYL